MRVAPEHRRRLPSVICPPIVLILGGCLGTEAPPDMVSRRRPEGLAPVTPAELAKGPIEVTAAELEEGPVRRPDLLGRYVRVFFTLGRSSYLISGRNAFLLFGAEARRGRDFAILVDAAWGVWLPFEGCWLAGRVGTSGGDFPRSLVGYPGPFCRRLPPRRHWWFVIDTRTAPQDPDLEARRAEERREFEALTGETTAEPPDGSGAAGASEGREE